MSTTITLQSSPIGRCVEEDSDKRRHAQRTHDLHAQKCPGGFTGRGTQCDMDVDHGTVAGLGRHL